MALKRTIDSLKGICDEFIVGSVCIFPEDDQAIVNMKHEYNVKVIGLPFNHIYKYGFSDTLNCLASFATNPIVIYLNVGEVIEKADGDILGKISPEYNCYYIDHSQENHRWYRCYNHLEMKWSGLIHEDLIGEHKPYHKPIFTFADTDKDMDSPFKAKVYNDVKELCYWEQLCKIVDDPNLLAGTDAGWINFAKDNYESMQERLNKKGNRYEAFETGNYFMYMSDIYSNPEFKDELFESNHMIEFQGDPMYLGKK
jgi:hypothetical protein